MQRCTSGLLAGLALTCVLTSSPGEACTVFLVARGDAVLAGNNEDWVDPDTRVWFVPAQQKKRRTTLGRVYFGFSDGRPQGGMNEKGLFFDGLALNGAEDEADPEKLEARGNLVDRVMANCSTVQEALDLLEKYDLGFGNAQLFFGDAGGDAVVVERNATHRKSGEFLVSTNFRLSRRTAEEAGCARYAAATGGIADCGVPTVESVREALAASKQDITLYSNVYDLVAGEVHLYVNHDFRTAIRFNLAEELAKGERSFELPDFFERRLLRQEASDL
jgi:hypothetical protein